MKTFAQLKAETLRFFDAANEDPDSADVELVSNAINNANQKRSSEDKWQWMLSPVYTLTTVVGQQDYILPQPNLLKFHYLYRPSTGEFASTVPMREVPYVETGFQQSYTANQTYYTITDAGSVVKAQPSTADTLVLSSTESEGAGIGMYIEGEDEDGSLISETVDVGETTDQEFAKVTYYAKTGDFEGTATLSTTGGTELLVLTSEESGKEYPLLTFLATPTEVATWQYRYFRKPRVMSRDYDRPDLPFPHSGILVYDALLDLATYNELDSESVNIWRSKQQEYLDILYQQKLDGDTIGGTTASIHG